MDVPDQAVGTPDDPAWETGLGGWDEAYARVEAYFSALRIRNKLLLSRLVYRVLKRAADMQRQSGGEPQVLAMQSTAKLVAEWFERVLDVKLPKERIAGRGRLALFLADMPGRWERYFLADPPWPEEFIERMRRSYLNAGPKFQARTMTPRPIELSAIVTGASQTWESLNRTPIIRAMISWTLVTAVVTGLVFFLW